jgi:translation elongation factor EF-Tu-like GTPase
VADKNTLIGRVADGILKKGEKVSVIRDGKIIAIGVAEDLQMFNKSLDETVKGDNVGIVFSRENGVMPSKGDIVVKYQPSHVVDTSDIIN